MDDQDLSPQQRAAFEAVVAGRNVFLTGPAGTGKTFTLNKIIAWAKERELKYAVTGTTGTAALLVRGRTLHSFLGIGLGTREASELVKQVKSKKADVYRQLQALELLIVDEVSMMSNHFFVKVSQYLSILRECDAPFGGVQLLLCGDFCQLPPVEPDYAFLCDEWDRCEFHTAHLTRSFRQQGDEAFLGLLNDLRWARVTAEHARTLRGLLSKAPPGDDVIPTRLFALNRDVDRINDEHLSELIKQGRPTGRYSTVTNCAEARSWSEMVHLPESLVVCEGCQVVLTRNMPHLSPSLVNGSRGVVVSVSSPQGPRVRFRSGETVIIPSVMVELDERKRLLKHERMVTTPTVSYVPIKLAYALTMHKSQGMTLDAVEIDLGPSVFTAGQAYTALSRARDLDSVWLTNFVPRSFMTDPEVVAFYRKLESP